MLKVYLHAGDLPNRNPGNVLAVLDVGYAKQAALSDYVVAMTQKEVGELAPDMVHSYPRWSGSLWDLVARAMTRILYRANQAPASQPADRRCAYAIGLCAVIEKSAQGEQGLELGTAQVTMSKKERGFYTVDLDEDILGAHHAKFSYGVKCLNPVDLMLRGICWSLYGQDTLGRVPKLILPPTLRVDGEERFHIESLDEPARTGFQRYRGMNFPTAEAPDPMPRADDYARFLTRG